MPVLFAVFFGVRRQATALQNDSTLPLGRSTQNKNGLKDIGLDKQDLNPLLPTPWRLAASCRMRYTVDACEGRRPERLGRP